jgi:peptide/nickel transport system substrate-binding protein
MRRLSLLAAALGVLAFAGGGAANASEPATAGEIAVVGLDFEPPCLNILLAGCNFEPAERTAGIALAGAFRRLPDSSFEPMLVDRVDVERQPFALTYRIRPEAVWSDGTPVSADDFIFTLGTIVDPQNTIANRAGYELVTEVTKLGPKMVRFQFSQGFAAWRGLFAHVLPKHVLAGRDFDQVWQDEIADPVTHAPIGSGPFLVSEWARGASLTVVRNPAWWGVRGPVLDAIRFQFIPDSNTLFQALRANQLDVIFPQPQLQLADLRTDPGVVVQSSPGTAIEHLDFNVGSTTMPLLRERWFRQAVAHAIDRDAVAEHAWSSLVPDYRAQHNLSFLSTQPEYVPSFARYAYDPAAVAELMTSHGCAMGADGIWSCSGVRASVRLATTPGNLLREQAQQDMRAQAAVAGIELVPDNTPGVFSRLPGRLYESIMFTWILSDAFAPVQKYGCAAVSNFMDYCSPAVTDLLERAETEVDPVLRA